ncbi:hypothetical protein M3J09_012864 [Ascochyta lentis]
MRLQRVPAILGLDQDSCHWSRELALVRWFGLLHVWQR